MEINDVQRAAPIGSQIVVTLHSGAQFVGRLSKLSEQAIVVVHDSQEMVISVSAIAVLACRNDGTVSSAIPTESASDDFPRAGDNASKAETPSGGFAERLPSSGGPAPTNQPTAPSVVVAVNQHPAVVQRETSDLRRRDLLARVANTETEFRTALAISRIDPADFIEILPETAMQGLIYDQRRRLTSSWDSCRGQYHAALRLKDLSRFQQIIFTLRMVAQEHRSLWCAHFNVGCLYMALDKNLDAASWFLDAARVSDESIPFYNAGVALLRHGDAVGAQDSLVEFFRRHPIAVSAQAWYMLLKLAMQTGTTGYLTEMFDSAAHNQHSDDMRLIARTASFLLKDAGIEAGALAVEEALESSAGADAQAIFRKWAGHVSRPGPLRAPLLSRFKSFGAGAQPATPSATIPAIKATISAINRTPRSVAAVSRLLKTEPDNEAAQRREADIARARIRTLPAGEGPYRWAKRAETVEKDYQKAERLYKEAIAKDDRIESAVKDLAWMLAGQDRARAKEGVELLLKYRSRMKAKLPFMQMLVALYERSEDYENAIPLLRSIHGLVPTNRQVEILKRIAVAYTKLQDYDHAESTLAEVIRLSPGDTSAKVLLEGLSQARETGAYSGLEPPVLPLELYIESRSRLSDFLNYFLEKCDYEGVEATTRASGDFSEADVKLLDRKADQLGAGRPEERAAYYLSAAKILILKLGVAADDRQPRSYLRNFAAAMGDFAILQQRQADVSRTFYAEAFAVALGWAEQLNVKLTQFIMLSYATPADVLKPNLPWIEASLERALSYAQLRQPLMEDLFSLSLLNPELPNVLYDRVRKSKTLMAQFLDICRQGLGVSAVGNEGAEEWGRLWNSGLESVRKRQQEVLDNLRFIDSQAETLDALQEQVTRLQDLQAALPWMLDKRRLNEVSEIVGLIRTFVQQQRYGEQERLGNTITNRIRELVDQIESSPTKLSLEYFRPYLIKIGKTVDEHFARVREAAEPDRLNVTLLIEFVTPADGTNEIECHIEVKNADGKSPASSVVLEVLDADAGEYNARQRLVKVSEALQGGERVTCPVPLIVSSSGIEAGVFDLNFVLHYSTRGGRTVALLNELPVGLFGNEKFVPIDPNPYAAWVQSGAVRDEGMFYGRGALIDRIVATIESTEANKSLVIYGQKRAGKSSVLYHLGRRLAKPPVIPVSFSVDEGILSITLQSFLYKILQEISRAVRKIGLDGAPELPHLEQFEKYPELLFYQFMDALMDALGRHPKYENGRIMLLLDEFADLYSAIRTGRIPDSFMKAWKAMLEKQYFGSVLVGSLVMRDFIDHFPNEFQVAEPIRVSYLDPPDARKLIEHIGESRYCGPAVERLLDLTACSPFYIQIFCNRLVSYINDKKRRVSDADIERVKEDLLRGANCLDRSSFDNLLTAGDRAVDPFQREDVDNVLRAIATGTKTQRWFDPTVTLGNASAAPILSALEKWDVLERHSSLYRIRVGLFREWLLATQ